jgi:hypothetical protein
MSDDLGSIEFKENCVKGLNDTLLKYVTKSKEILNEEMFEKSKTDLLEKILDKPEGYMGLFRPTKKPMAREFYKACYNHKKSNLEMFLERYVDYWSMLLKNWLQYKEFAKAMKLT